MDQAETPTASAKRLQLQRKKRLATGALLLAAAAFVAGLLLRHHGWWAGLLAAAGEAGMVGGLADWFAVTALFRRPLGLPIPHTALIPTRKDEIGRSMARFIEEHFLDPPVILARLREQNRAAQLGRWLASPATSTALAGNLVDALPHVIGTVDDARVRKLLQETIGGRLGNLDLVPAARQLADALLAEGRHLVFLDALLGQLRLFLAEHRDSLAETVGRYTGRYIPGFVDRELAKLLIKGIEGWIDRVLVLDSDARARFDVFLRARVEAFLDSPELPDFIAGATSRLTANPAFQGMVGAIWDDLKQALTAETEKTPSHIGTLIADTLSRFGEALAHSPELQRVLNAAVERVVVNYLTPWRAEIGTFIADVVRRWDGRRVSDIIELQVGADLQYVRVNGTVIGSLVGALLFAIATLVTRFG